MDKIPTILFYMALIVVVCVIAALLLSLAFYVLFDRGGSFDYQDKEPIDSIFKDWDETNDEEMRRYIEVVKQKE